MVQGSAICHININGVVCMGDDPVNCVVRKRFMSTMEDGLYLRDFHGSLNQISGKRRLLDILEVSRRGLLFIYRGMYV